MLRTAELRQDLAKTNDALQAMLAKATAEKRSLNTEEQASFDKMSESIGSIVKTIQAEERAIETAALLNSEKESRGGSDDTNVRDQREIAHREAFAAYLRCGLYPHQTGDKGISEEQRAILLENRAQSVGTNSAGGFTVPQGFGDEIIVAAKSFSGVLQAPVRQFRTDSGNPIPWPLSDDTANAASILAENTATTDLDIAFTQTTFGAWKYTTRSIKVSTELLQDSAFDIEQFLRERFSERLGRGWNTHLTTGDGSTQPQGCVTASILGKTTAGAAAVTSDEILDLIHSVDPAYRAMNGFRLMFNDSTLKAILQLKDSQNRPLFQPSYRDAAPATIHGYPFVINQAMASIATGNKFMLAGDFGAMRIRLVKSLDVLRLNELNALSAQVTFVGFARMDAKVLDAGQNPIKHMKNA